MCCFNKGGRFIRVMGTDGELYGDMEENMINYYSFKTKKNTIINPLEEVRDGSVVGGHGGGDDGIVEILYKYLTEDYNVDMLSEIGISVYNHLITFAAEQSRIENKVINVYEFIQNYLK